MTADSRKAQLIHWLNNQLEHATYTLETASADASFRRYFRVMQNGQTLIAMDAPPDKEDSQPFIDITERLRKKNLHAPEIIASDLAQGFILMEDLGDSPYLYSLDKDNVDDLYKAAMSALITMQGANRNGLPIYSRELLQQEMNLMQEWFLAKHLGITLNTSQQNTLNTVYTTLLDNISQHPIAFVHRDYHSRNLMITEENNPGIIDFQDAVQGSIAYDLVSLLRDCYIEWPTDQVYNWVDWFHTKAVKADLIQPEYTPEQFRYDFDMMGLQRHIKVLGIFARLNHRDGKPGYLNDIPLTLHYVLSIAKRHKSTLPLVKLFDEINISKLISTTEAIA